MSLKLCTIQFQHAEWLSKNRLADPTVGDDNDGYLFSALTGGFHANFDGSYMEDAADDSGLSVAVVDVVGDLIYCNSTALNTVTRLPMVANSILTSNAGATAPVWMAAATVGRVAVGSAAGPKMLAAPAADGAFAVGNNTVDMSYVPAVALGRVMTSGGAGVAPKYLAAGTLGQTLISAGAADPVWQTRDFNTVTTIITGVVAGITGMTANGAVVGMFTEDPVGAGTERYVISHILPGIDSVTVYVRDTSIADPVVVVMPVVRKIAIHVVAFS